MPLRSFVVALGVLSGVLATAAPLYAQHDYLLRYAADTEAARLVDSLIAGGKPPHGPRGAAYAKTCRRFAASAADATQRVAALSAEIPPSRWQRVGGVIRVARARPLQRRGGLPNDPTFPEQWHLRRIDAPGAWDYTTGGRTVDGREVVIGVIELDGIDLAHPDLRDNLYVNAAEVPGNGLDDDGNGYVDDVTGVNFDDPLSNRIEAFPHGTHVAGVLAARGNDGSQAAGLNWVARLLPFQIETTVDWVLALDYLTALRRRYNETGGADGAYVVVVNCSFGADDVDCAAEADFAEVDAAIDRAGEVGILTVAATTNDTGDADRRPAAPSSCPTDYLISVTASDREDQLRAGAGFSGTRVDVAAPGSAFGSLDVRSFGRVEATFSGTSGATPQVAGAVALMYAAACERTVAASLRQPAATALAFRKALLAGVDPVAELSARVSSGGRLNVRRAVEAALAGGPCASDGVLIQLNADGVAPVTITSAAALLTLTDTISRSLGLYRYAVTAGAPEDALDAALATGGVTRATHDRPLLGADAAFGYGDGRDYLDELGTEAATELVERGGAGFPQAVVLFDLGFAERPATALADGARGLGLAGEALADVVTAVTGEDDVALALYRGRRLSDWLRAVALATEAAAGRAEGPATVFASGVRVGGTSGPTAAAFVDLVTEGFVAAGGLAVVPAGAVGADRGAIVAAEVSDEAAGRIGVSPGAIPYGDPGAGCVVAGGLAAVAQLAGATATVARAGCGSPGGGEDEEVARALARASGEGGLDVLGAVRLRLAGCERDAPASGIRLVYPSAAAAGALLRVVYASEGATEIHVVDAVGRVVRQIQLSGGASDNAARVPTAGLAAGVYYLRLAGDRGSAAVPFAILE